EIGLIAAVGSAAPQRNLDGILHAAYLTVTCTRCTTLLPKPPMSQRGSTGWLSPLPSVALQASSCSPGVAFHAKRHALQAYGPGPGSSSASSHRPSTPSSTRAIGTPPPDQARPNSGTRPASTIRARV